MSPRAACVLLSFTACTGGGETDTTTHDTDDPTGAPPTHYAFASRFTAGTSSVSYSGQSFRHLLIHDLDAYLGELTLDIDTGFFPVPGEITDALEFYFEFDSSTSGAIPHAFTSQPAPAQVVYDDVSANRTL